METKLLMQLLTLGTLALFILLFIAVTMAMAGRKKRNTPETYSSDYKYTIMGNYILAGIFKILIFTPITYNVYSRIASLKINYYLITYE
uniref:Uncharacterized protein n=1 Tax=Lepeophtheirus salmonis TaxID=72036 RepID=A0A0K2VLB0_LEPSM